MQLNVFVRSRQPKFRQRGNFDSFSEKVNVSIMRVFNQQALT